MMLRRMSKGRFSLKPLLILSAVVAVLLMPSIIFSIAPPNDHYLTWPIVALIRDILLFAIAAYLFFKLGGMTTRVKTDPSPELPRAILDELADGIALFGPDDKPLYINDSFKDICGESLPTTADQAMQLLKDRNSSRIPPLFRTTPVGSAIIIPSVSPERVAYPVEVPHRNLGFEAILDAIPVPIVVSNLHRGTIRHVNRAAKKMYGVNEANGKPLTVVFKAADVARIFENLPKDGTVSENEIEVVSSGREARWIKGCSVTADIGGETSLITIAIGAVASGANAETDPWQKWLEAVTAFVNGDVIAVDRSGIIQAIVRAADADQYLPGQSFVDTLDVESRDDMLNALARSVATGDITEFQSGSVSGIRVIPVKDGHQIDSLLLVFGQPPSKSEESNQRDTRNRSRRLFFDNPLPQLLVDPKTGRIVALNASARTFYGYGDVGDLDLHFDAVDSQGIGAIAPLGADGESSKQIAYRSSHALESGETREVEVRGRILEDDGRRLAYLVVNDITDMKHASEALRESEARFRAVFEHGPVGIAILDLNGRVIRANPTWQDTLEYSHEALRSLSFVELSHPDDRRRIERHLDATVSSTVIGESFEARFIRRDGQVLWVQFSAALQRDESGRPQFVIVMMSDISERKAAEQALRMSEERLRAIIDNSPAMIYVMDRQGRHLLVNARFEELTGLSEFEVRGKTAFDYLPQDTAEKVMADIQRVIDSGVPLTREESIIVRGDERLFVTVKFPLFTPDGTVYGLCAIATDITEHRQTEESLRQVQKMDAIGQLTGGVAHDFNNLLTVVQGNLEWLAERLKDDETGVGLVESALEASRMGSSLTQRLLAFSRKQSLKPETVNLQEAVLRVDPLLVRTLGETVALQTQIPGGLWKVRIDPQQLENSLLNLALNARDAMAGGGTLTIELSNESLPADTANRRGIEPGDYVRLMVSDTGTGMSPEVIQRAFEPFFTTKEKGKGTGLGLSMVYGFVRQSGGFIDIESERGQGTRIIIHLPRADVEVPASVKVKSTDSESLPRGTETVLVVEDDPRVRRLAVGILEWLGYAVLEADDGPSAIELLEDNDDVDIVFSDVVMPGGMSGFDVAAQAREIAPEAKILFVSGYSHEEMERVGVVPAEIEMLPKPFTRHELAQKIREVLDR